MLSRMMGASGTQLLLSGVPNNPSVNSRFCNRSGKNTGDRASHTWNAGPHIIPGRQKKVLIYTCMHPAEVDELGTCRKTL